MSEVPWFIVPFLAAFVLAYVAVTWWFHGRAVKRAEELDAIRAQTTALAGAVAFRSKPSLFQSYEAMALTVPLAAGNWCKDCGQALVSVRKQRGFIPETGEPNYTYDKVCRDFDASKTGWGSALGPYCGNIKVEDALPNAHTHSDPTDLHTDCPPCIDLMVRDRVIDDEQAEKLYEAAGMQVRPDFSIKPGGTLDQLQRAWGGSMVQLLPSHATKDDINSMRRAAGLDPFP